MTQSFSHPLHAFRGFAILNVVAIHAFAVILIYTNNTGGVVGWPPVMLGTMSQVLFHDSTLYFTFISGILFSRILADRGYTRFFRSKLLYVVLPYIVVTVVYSLRVSNGPFGTPAGVFDGGLQEFGALVGINLVTGMATLIFWYIPVLLALYAMTPVLDWLSRSRGAVIPVLVIILAPLVCSRVFPDVTWANYVYFLGAYLIGILVGRNYERTIEVSRERGHLLVIVAVVTTAFIAAAQNLEIPVYGVTVLAESAWYLQKIALAGLALVWFERTMAKRVPNWLKFCGDYAFAIYFLHMIPLLVLVEIMARAGIRVDSTAVLLAFMSLSLVLSLAGAVLLTWIFRRVLGRYSRCVIGA